MIFIAVKFYHTIYSAHELKRLFIEAGFSTIKVYGDLDGNDYGPGADKLIAVAAH